MRGNDRLKPGKFLNLVWHNGNKIRQLSVSLLWYSRSRIFSNIGRFYWITLYKMWKKFWATWKAVNFVVQDFLYNQREFLDRKSIGSKSLNRHWCKILWPNSSNLMAWKKLSYLSIILHWNFLEILNISEIAAHLIFQLISVGDVIRFLDHKPQKWQTDDTVL